ncbi:MAG: fused MFS/spermidine synthase [Anaerolineaceae bacterium]|nr:fused MFS/spermidine synthase [Anaerolineaceae bacterium]
MQDESNRSYLYVVVFFSGLTTLAVELSASRLLGAVFGTSNLVWANIIGLMLLYLTVGYFVGGRLADRYPHRKTLYTILLWAAFLCALIPLIARPILYAAAEAFASFEAALTLGSFAAVIFLFAIPVTMMGMTSPFAIRLATTNVENSGRISGQIYALSTVGSLLGTFLPTLVLFDRVGTALTFLIVAGVLFLVTWIGLWQVIGLRRASKFLWMPIVIAVLAVVTLNGPVRPAPSGEEILFEAESSYNYIQVTEDEAGYRYLYLNEGQGIHSQWHPTQILYGRTWDYFLIAPYFNTDFQPEDMQSILVIGLATGTIARQYAAVYGNDLKIDGVEIDPEIIEAGERYFDMNRDAMPGLTSYAQDGRYVLNQLDGPYTVIGVDAYRPPYIPWHLTTIEFFQEIYDKLADNGVLVINVGRTNTDRRLVDALSNTLSYVFADIHAMDVPSSFNTILVATRQPTASMTLIENAQRIDPDAYPLLSQAVGLASQSLVPVNRNDIVFTDDKAPVESLVDSIVLNFLLGGGVEDLR